MSLRLIGAAFGTTRSAAAKVVTAIDAKPKKASAPSFPKAIGAKPECDGGHHQKHDDRKRAAEVDVANVQYRVPFPAKDGKLTAINGDLRARERDAPGRYRNTVWVVRG